MYVLYMYVLQIVSEKNVYTKIIIYMQLDFPCIIKMVSYAIISPNVLYIIIVIYNRLTEWIIKQISAIKLQYYEVL